MFLNNVCIIFVKKLETGGMKKRSLTLRKMVGSENPPPVFKKHEIMKIKELIKRFTQDFGPNLAYRKKKFFVVLKETAIKFHSDINNEPEILEDETINDYYHRLFDDWFKENVGE